MNIVKNIETFIDELVNTFPEIRKDVLDEDYAGVITLQLGCFKRFTQKAIDANDTNMVEKCFQFVDANIGLVEHKIENALYISYLSHLNIAKNSKAEKLLPNRLRSALVDLKGYENSAAKNDKLNKFLNDL